MVACMTLRKSFQGHSLGRNAYPGAVIKLSIVVARASTMDAILVRGQPYQTVQYRSLAPVVSTVHAVLTVNGAAAVPGAAITGTRFVLGLNSGATWTVSPFSACLLLAFSLTGICNQSVSLGDSHGRALD